MSYESPVLRTADNTLRAFAAALEDHAVNGMVPVAVIRSLTARLCGDGSPLTTYFNAAESAFQAHLTALKLDGERRDYLGRAITKSLIPLLDDPDSGVNREHLGQLFTAIRLILGDHVHSVLQEGCVMLVAEMRQPDGSIPWDRFYDDPRLHTIMNTVRACVAKAFVNREARKDWFLTVMNTHHHDVPLHHVALPQIAYFGEAQMQAVIDALLVRPA
jgi:hypothetical protein